MRQQVLLFLGLALRVSAKAAAFGAGPGAVGIVEDLPSSTRGGDGVVARVDALVERFDTEFNPDS